METGLDLRGSAMPLFMACAQSAARPKGERLIDQHNPDGAIGTAAHSALRMILSDGIDADISIPSLCALHGCKPDDVAPLVYGGLSLWSKVKEHFKEPQFELPLTAETTLGPIDCTLDIASTKSWNFWDWKFGGREREHFHQMAAYANAMMEMADSMGARVEQITCVVAYPRLGFWDVNGPDGSWTFTRPMLKEWDANLALHAHNQRETYRPGEHCGFCRRQFGCKARQDWMAGTMRALALNHPEAFLVERERLPELVTKISQAEKMLKTMRETIKAHVEATGPIPVGEDGKVLGIKSKNVREVKSLNGAMSLLGSLSSPMAARGCLELSLKKADAAIRDATPQGKKGEAVKAWKETCVKEGAVELIEQRELRVFNPKEKGEDE